MAVHGKNFLKDASVYSTLLEAINDCARVVATCGRIDHGDIPLHSNNEALHWATESEKNEKVGKMIFGSIYPLYLNRLEKKGRTQQELNQVIE